MTSSALDLVGARIEAILPDHAVRAAQLSIFAGSLSYIDDRNSSGWLTHLLKDRIRLLAGRLIVVTLEDGVVWLPVDASGNTAALSRLTSWKWDTASYPQYRRPPSRNGYYDPSTDDDQDWPQIRELHFSYLDRLLDRPRAVDPRSAARHEPLIVDYLTAALQRTIPCPLSVRLAEELPVSGRYWEGAVARVAVNRFERDRGAREECLRRLGRKCAGCEMSFGQRYGMELDWLIHVHHVVPLSAIREGYTPDPIRDLVPVCPNCHAVIHAGGETRSIEEVRGMLVRAAAIGSRAQATSQSLPPAVRTRDAQAARRSAVEGWTTRIGQTTLIADFEAAIRTLPMRDRFDRADLLIPSLRLHRDGRLEMYYAPFDSVNPSAAVILLGITPGWTQMEVAFRVAQRELQLGSAPEEICRRAKQNASFAGKMRTNLVRMLDDLGVAPVLGIETSADLFASAAMLLHAGSAIRYPVFVNGRNYTGHNPDLLRNPFLRQCVESMLADELASVPNAIVVPPGNAVSAALQHLVGLGKVSKERCLFGFPHPSGANGRRLKDFAAHRRDLAEKVSYYFQTTSGWNRRSDHSGDHFCAARQEGPEPVPCCLHSMPSRDET